MAEQSKGWAFWEGDGGLDTYMYCMCLFFNTSFSSSNLTKMMGKITLKASFSNTKRKREETKAVLWKLENRWVSGDPLGRSEGSVES